MTTDEVKLLLKTLYNREMELDMRGFVDDLYGIQEMNPGDTIATLVAALGLTQFFKDIKMDLATLKQRTAFNEDVKYWKSKIAERSL